VSNTDEARIDVERSSLARCVSPRSGGRRCRDV